MLNIIFSYDARNYVCIRKKTRTSKKGVEGNCKGSVMIKEVDGDSYIKVSKEHQPHCEMETKKIIAKSNLFKSIEEAGMGTPSFVWNGKIKETE